MVEKIFEKIETKKRYCLLIYTLIFLVTFSIMFITFIIKGRSFIWQEDGYTQHLKTLMYIHKYYVGAFTSGEFPSYDFNLGLGGNIFTVLTYYGFFDPINILSVLVPLKYTEYLYSFLIMLRVYLSGLTFILMCIYFGKKKTYSIIGALIYISTTYVLYIGIKHPFFLNPMIYLPILIVGLDKILQKKKPYLFIFGISFSALSGFYFLYMMSIMLFLYANIRFFKLYKESEKKIKEYVNAVLRTILWYLLGIGLAGVVFFPNLIAFLESNRIAKIESFYSILDFAYFKNMLSLFYARGGDYNFSISSLIFFTLIIVFFKYRKTEKALLCMTALSIVGLGVPLFGKLMNGFSYPSNRWMFGTGLLLAYLFVDTIDEILERKHDKIILKILVVANVLYLVRFVINLSPYQILGIVLVDISYFLIYHLKIRVVALTVLIIVNAGFVGAMTHFVAEYSEDYKKYGNYAKYEDSQESYLKNFENKNNKEFSRVDGNNFSVNQAFITGIPNSTMYFSIINPYIITFFNELQIANNKAKIYVLGTDGRAVTGSLISNKYFIAQDKDKGEVPYGYFLKNVDKKYSIYENKNFLPFGYTYDKYATYDEVKDKFSLDKEANMLDMVYLEEDVPNIEKVGLQNYYTEVPYKIKADEGIQYRSKEYLDFDSNKDEEQKSDKNKDINAEDEVKKYLKFLFEVDKKNEAYLYLDSILLDDNYSIAKISLQASKVSKKDLVRSKKSVSYFDRNSLLFNLGNANKKKKWTKINFDLNLLYPISDIKILSVPLGDFAKKINKLKEDRLENVKFETNKVSGSIKLTRSKILTMSIPYEHGWRAYVDGKETPILRGNYMFCCLALDKGEHKIELIYKTEGGRASAMLSGLSLMVLIAMIGMDLRRKKDVGISDNTVL